MADTILGNIRKRAGTILENPFVQGAAGAAAIGANPLAGLLFGPLIADDRERRKLKLEEARGRVEAQNLAIDETKARRAAINRLPKLLGPDPFLTQGIDENDAVLPLPPAMEAERKQQGRRADLFGALADLSPQAAAQSIFGDLLPRKPTSIAELEAVGVTEPTMQDLIDLEKAKNPTDRSDLLDQILTGLNIDLKTKELDDVNKQERQERLLRETTVVDTLDVIKSLANVTDKLENSMLAPGSTALDFKRTLADVGSTAAGLFGVDDEGLAELVSDLDTFRKESGVLYAQAIQNMESAGIPVTNAITRVLGQFQPGETITADANRRVMKLILKQNLRTADIYDIEVENRAEIEQLIKDLDKAGRESVKSYKTPEEAQAAFEAGEYEAGETIVIDGKRVSTRLK